MVAHPAGRFKPQDSSKAIYLNGKAVGYVRRGVFRKTVNSSRHFLRTPPAICYDRSTLSDAEAAGATRLEVRDADTNFSYSAPLAVFWAHCFPVLRGHGDQVGMHLDYWSVGGETPIAEKRAGQTNKERLGLQPGLFGGAA